jgi:NAD(P)-dependent dehydrogenase (short-subunit alcohol dehydrogenase family)
MNREAATSASIGQPQNQEESMRIILFGTGTIGAAVKATLQASGHDVRTVSRNAGADLLADLTDAKSLRTLFENAGAFDSVACAAGDVFSAPLEHATDEQWAKSFASKAMGQINVVRMALPFISDRGSFTLISGIVGEEPIGGGVIMGTINQTVEGFVRAAAFDLPRGIRINCVSPTVLAESVPYHPLFPGFSPVDAPQVALAYLRAIATPVNGRVIKLHKTSS